MTENLTSSEPYLLVEEVAERLGLPLSVLLHRVEAGDIPAMRVEREDGPHYALRLSDLGIESEAEPASEEGPGEAAGRAVFDDRASEGWESAIVSAFNSHSEQSKVEPVATLDVTGHRVEHEAAASEAAEVPGSRPREPQEPPEWLIGGYDEGADAAATVDHPLTAETSGPAETSGLEQPAIVRADAAAFPGEGSADLAVPPPPQAREPQFGILDAAVSSPRGDLAAMSLDARELVAGLLDRWERTLEQRIYTEQRQRFHGELMARQNMVKQLQMELHTARAEHAAAQAEKDRLLAEKERELADRERDLADTRRVAEEAERLAPAARRRRWFWSRDD